MPRSLAPASCRDAPVWPLPSKAKKKSGAVENGLLVGMQTDVLGGICSSLLRATEDTRKRSVDDLMCTCVLYISATYCRAADHRTRRRTRAGISLSALPPPSVMALLLTIFLLVLTSQIISWIGSSVLQEFVRESLVNLSHTRLMIHRSSALSTYVSSTPS